MTLHEQAATLSHDEIVELLRSQAALAARVNELQRQVDWFNRQLFGSKSERRRVGPQPSQLTLGESLIATHPAADSAPSIPVTAHARHPRQAKDPDDSGLRFDPQVPVEDIDVVDPEIEALPAESYTVVGFKETCRLAQRPGSYVVLRYRRKVIKRKDSGEFLCAPAPAAVFEKSVADVSLLAGLLIDKFLFHLPLYRQHQRMALSGVQLARSTLTHLVHRSGDLLEPIYEAQRASILAGDTATMDESPIKAFRKHKGKMKTGYFWPVYGDRKEVIFPFFPTRSGAVIPEVLGDFKGTLLTDGYEPYASYAAQTADLEHAQCWSHTRRQFVEAEGSVPDLSGQALDRIRELYDIEEQIRQHALQGEQKLSFRLEHSQPRVDAFFKWLLSVENEQLLLPSSPFTQAASYATSRERALRVFLANPDVPIDTNHLEREIRPLAVGRKNWLFCWTEIGARYVGIFQSLLRTCLLHGIDPYRYLVDVLQRVATHPAKDVGELIPRCWKERFGDQPLRSHVDLLARIPQES